MRTTFMHSSIVEKRPEAWMFRVRGQVARWRETLRRDWAGIIQGLNLANLGEPGVDERVRHKARAAFLAGIFGLVSWPLLVLLNLVILGQITELFSPTSGQPWVVPGLGPIEPMALLLAAIVAVAEAIFSIAAWEGENAPIQMIAGLSWVAAVAFEVYGAWLRGQMLGTLDMGSGAGPLSGHSASVSALIGFVAPAAESVASILAFCGVLKPLGISGLRVPRMIHHVIMLRIYSIRYRFLDTVWILPEISAQQDAVQRLASDNNELLAEARKASVGAERVLRDAVAASEGQEDATSVDRRAVVDTEKNHAAAAQGVLDRLEAALTTLAGKRILTDPVSAPSTAGQPDDDLDDLRENCRRRVRDLQVQLLEPAVAAHKSDVATLRKLSQHHVGAAATGLPDRTAIHRLSERFDALAADRQAVLTALEHALSCDTFSLYDRRSQERNLAIVMDLLVTLDGDKNKAGLGKTDLSLRREKVRAEIERRIAAALPAKSPLEQTGRAVESAGKQGDRAHAALALHDHTDVILAAPDYERMITRADECLTVLRHRVDDVIAALRKQETRAVALQAETGQWARVRSWLVRAITGRPAGPATLRAGVPAESDGTLTERL